MPEPVEMVDLLEELSETSRRQLLSELRSGPRSVNELVRSTGLKQPNVSNHLARMKARGVVSAKKVGRQVFYGLASPEVEAVLMSVFSRTPATDVDFDIEDLVKQYAKAAVQGDEQACSEIFDILFRAKLPLLDIYQDILAPAMTLVGIWYKVEAIDAGQEHLASAITERMMARAVQIAGPIRRHGMVTILGCAPDNYHVIGLRMISDYLRLCGWKTLFLGANTPEKSFVSAVHMHKPTMVLLGCGASEGVDATNEIIKLLVVERAKRKSFLIGVGGAIAELYADSFKNAGADFIATNLRTFATTILPAVEKGEMQFQPASGSED